MNDMPVNPNNMIETSDSLEAVGVFRAWKNIFFVIVVICLVLTQVAFWVVDLGLIETPGAIKPADTAQSGSAASTDETSSDGGLLHSLAGKLDFDRVARVIGVANGILIVSGILFALTVFFCLMVSLVGRLGGINHISRAFILALIMAALIIPWQRLFGSNVVGVAYGGDELLRWLDSKSGGMSNLIFYYLRFTGLWLVVLLLMIMAQVRSSGWSKSILRRLEII
ncbi:MAG TPA: hypothetical protein PK373_07395 [Sedimentisphaerales bacterium]|nr:hypothetical protein [Phycisphaerae bacterium]HON90922.1 hypothetical protein [Sedimentisphaerales bacterium]HQG48897.1 hypothetical protein [Sedimentisphaerales bacterium]HQI26956.1 hypothetical protein [Sedimentisphaerales bacterium]